MLSGETIKISLFSSRVKFLWPKIQNDYQKVIDNFYKDFVDLFIYKETEDIISHFIYNGEIGVIGVIIFDKMVNIFINNGLLYKEYPNISIPIADYIIRNNYHKNLLASDLCLILNVKLETRDLNEIQNIINIIRNRKEWKSKFDLDLLYCYKKSLLFLRQIHNEQSLLYIPKPSMSNNIFSRLYPKYWFINYKYVNNSELLSNPMYIFMIDSLNNKKVILNYCEGISSGILLYFLWFARENKIIDDLHVAYIKESKKLFSMFSEAFIIKLCTENHIPLRIRTMKELNLVKELKKEYISQVKIDILSDLGRFIMSGNNKYVNPLKYFSIKDKLSLVKRYKIPYDCLEENS